MRKITCIPLLALLACEGSGPGETVHHQGPQSPLCSGTDVPIYKNRFTAQYGASGVATAPEAAAGVISSDAPAGGTAGPVATSAPATSASGAPAASPPAPASTGAGGAGTAADGGTGDGTYTAMTVTCGAAPCVPGEVAVEVPPTVSGGSGAAAGGIGIAGPVAATAGASAPAAAAPASTPSTPSAPPTNLVCASPPPSCPEGQSPQFTGKQTWECTDCALVVTYGGIYGNYRRCVDMPHLTCPDGEVPTWVYEDEQWECKTKCDNGQYDQHTIQGVMVCVPC
jgi:hypothetical protein